MKEAYNKSAYKKAYVLNSNSFVMPKVYTLTLVQCKLRKCRVNFYILRLPSNGMQHHAVRYVGTRVSKKFAICLFRGKGEDGVSSFYLNGGRVIVLSSDGDYCKE